MVVDDSGDDGDDNCGNGNEDGMTMVIRALITCQALLSALHIVKRLILTATLWGRYCYVQMRKPKYR
jgi:hypothetical protein